MENRFKIASILLYIICVLFILAAATLLIVGVFRGALLPPMEHIAGMSTQELKAINPGIVKLIVLLTGMMAASLLAFAVGIFMLTKGPLNNQMAWARNTIFAILVVYLPIAEIITLQAFPHGSSLPRCA